MTTLAEMRSEVARDHGWHEDDDGDRIDEVLNERFGQAAVEMYAAAEVMVDRDCVIHGDAVVIQFGSHSEALSALLNLRTALSKARAQ